MSYRQHTVVEDVSCTGIGLHSGKKVRLTIKPAPPDSGIRFFRNDLPGNRSIRANWKNVVDTNMSTTIGMNGCKVSTIEHLMAAFFGLGIDNARVEVDGPEIPIMDGSAAPFIFMIKSVGIKEQKKFKQFIIIKKPLKITDGNRSINIFPSKELRISFTIDFYHPLLRNQRYDLAFSGREFINEISRARTFGFLKDIKLLREAGLAMGGSLDNAIVIDDFRILNEDGLRYKNEFVRHKILDFIGDLAVIGTPIIGKFEIQKSGHSLNHSMLKELIANKNCWERIIPEEQEGDLLKSVKIPVFAPLDQAPVSV